MRNLIYLLLVATLLLTGACKKKETEDTTDQSLGNLSGKIYQYNQYGEKLSTGLNSVLITLDNDNVVAVSDEAGNYTLKDVKPGVYTITYAKQGCKNNQKTQINFPGNGTMELGETYMVQNPTYTFNSATASLSNDTSQFGPYTGMNVNIKLSPINKPVYAALIFNDSENFDNVSPNAFSVPITIVIPANTSDYTPATFSTKRQVKGSSLYVKVYPYCGVYTPHLKNEDNSFTYFGYGTALPAIKLN